MIVHVARLALVLMQATAHVSAHQSGRATIHSASSATDSTSVRESLRKRIDGFEELWQRVWKEQQEAVHGPLLVRARSRLDPDSRRATMLGCYRATAVQLAMNKTSLIPLNAVSTHPDRGSVCPGWLAPGEPIPGDEAESIDLALSLERARTVRVARDELLRQLSTGQQQAPGDWWISGQRVRFLIDQRLFAEAIDVAASCRGNPRFCAALAGLAAHMGQQPSSADSAFRVADSLEAIASSPVRAATTVATVAADTAQEEVAKDGCSRLDVLALFAREDRQRLSRESCEQRSLLVDRIWWLADPLWSIAGNERFVAHHARRIHTELRAIDDNDERYVWSRYAAGLSLRETVLRFGWPTHTYWPGWLHEGRNERAVLRAATSIPVRGGPRNVRLTYYPLSTKEYATDRIALMPSLGAVMDPFSATVSDWTLYNPDLQDPDGWWPPEHMALPLRLLQLPEGQQALWRRDTSVAYALAIDDALREAVAGGTDSLTAVLVGGDSPANTTSLANASVAPGQTLRMRAELSPRPIVLGAEIMLPATPAVALRSRAGLRPPPALREMSSAAIAVSDPVFVRLAARGDAAPTEPTRAEALMAGSLAFPRVATVALYWESYGIRPGDTVQVTLTIRRDDSWGALRRAAAAVGVASDLRDSISIRWTEPDAQRGRTVLSERVPTMGRGLSIDLSELAPGTYLASIEMRTAAGAAARGTRQFRVIN